jgi:hypothetical protein
VNQHRPTGDNPGPGKHDSNEPATCCPAAPPISISLAINPLQLQPTVTWLQAAQTILTIDGNENAIAPTYSRDPFYRPSIPIFLATKSIIC